jgi:hypothetical protein
MWNGSNAVTKAMHYCVCFFIKNITFVIDLMQTVPLIELLNTAAVMGG